MNDSSIYSSSYSAILSCAETQRSVCLHYVQHKFLVASGLPRSNVCASFIHGRNLSRLGPQAAWKWG